MERADRLKKIPPYPFVEIARLKAKAIAEGVDLIDFGIGDPDRPTPPHIIEALCDAARDPRTHTYDESDFGLPEFRAAVARFMKRRYGVEVDEATEIQSLIGSKEGLAHIVWCYANPGDVVLVPDPGYSVYKVNAVFCTAVPYAMPLLQSNGYLLDFDLIPSDIAKQAKLLFLNYPNNPTGAAADLDFFERAVQFAKDHDILICHDAAYAEVTYDGYRAHSILEVPGAKDVAVEFHSLSKTFNMTGWRVGWAVGNSEVIAALSKLKSNLDSGVFMAVQRAAIAALDGPDEHIEEMRRGYQERRDLLVDGLKALGWPVEKPRATFYIWSPVPRGYTSERMARELLTECGILAIPGAAYGEHGEGYIRLSLTIKGDDKKAQIQEALRRIEANLSIEWE